jgi:hypothetical protein
MPSGAIPRTFGSGSLVGPPHLLVMIRSVFHPPGIVLVNSKLYAEQIKYSLQMKQFLIRSDIDRNYKSAIDYTTLANLSQFRYSPRGTLVTSEQWAELETLAKAINMELKDSGEERIREYLLWKVRSYFRFPAYIFSSVALAALIIYCIAGEASKWASVAVPIWTMGIGGLGVSAFFSTGIITQLPGSGSASNAPGGESVSPVAAEPGVSGVAPPSNQGSTNFAASRLNDENYLRDRIITGLIFSFILGICFGRASLHVAYAHITKTPIPFT